MNVTRMVRFVTRALGGVAIVTTPTLVAAQAGAGRGGASPDTTPVAPLVAERARVSLRVGDSVPLRLTAYDAAGRELPNAPVRVNAPRGTFSYANGFVRAQRAGEYTTTASATGASGPIEIPLA